MEEDSYIQCELRTNLNVEGVRQELGQIPSESFWSAGLCSEQDGGLLAFRQNLSHEECSETNSPAKRTEQNKGNNGQRLVALKLWAKQAKKKGQECGKAEHSEVHSIFSALFPIRN